MTSNPTSPAPPSTDEPSKPAAERPSALQITASALAAMTTTALLSTLGVAGTIIGAALASVITVLANFVYTTSIHRTREKVHTVVPHRGRLRPDDASGSTTEVAAAAGGSHPATGTADGAPPSRLERVRLAVRAAVDRVGWRRILAVIAGVFVLVLGAVTVIELATGKPLANVVRNEEGAGTSVFGRTTDVPVSPEEVDGPAPEQSPGTGPEDVPSPEPTEPAVPGDVLPTDEPTEVPSEQPAAPNPPAPGGDPAGSPEQPPLPPDASPEQPPVPPDVGAEQPPAPVSAERAPDPQPTPTPTG